MVTSYCRPVSRSTPTTGVFSSCRARGDTSSPLNAALLSGPAAPLTVMISCGDLAGGDVADLVGVAEPGDHRVPPGVEVPLAGEPPTLVVSPSFATKVPRNAGSCGLVAVTRNQPPGTRSSDRTLSTVMPTRATASSPSMSVRPAR